MAGKTLTRADLSAAVHRQIGLSRSESADLVKTILDMMSAHLVKGQTVRLATFCTFTVLATQRDGYYAYIETEFNGQPYRGFVNQKNIQLQ